jgi:hypothetical protein
MYCFYFSHADVNLLPDVEGDTLSAPVPDDGLADFEITSSFF